MVGTDRESLQVRPSWASLVWEQVAPLNQWLIHKLETSSDAWSGRLLHEKGQESAWLHSRAFWRRKDQGKGCWVDESKRETTSWASEDGLLPTALYALNHGDNPVQETLVCFGGPALRNVERKLFETAFVDLHWFPVGWPASILRCKLRPALCTQSLEQVKRRKLTQM